MTTSQIIGACLLALPFVVITAAVVRKDGFREFLIVLGLTVATIVPIAAGSYMLVGP